jgi:hypothetical protein
MGTSSRTQAGALLEATAAQARLANSTLHQFQQGWNPTPSSLAADFAAHEADYDGYAAITLTAWAAPVLAPGSGWMTFGPQSTFRWVFDTDAVGNAIAGYWVQTAGGVVTDYVIYDEAKMMQGPGQSDTQTPVEVFPATPVS